MHPDAAPRQPAPWPGTPAIGALTPGSVDRASSQIWHPLDPGGPGSGSCCPDSPRALSLPPGRRRPVAPPGVGRADIDYFHGSSVHSAGELPGDSQRRPPCLGSRPERASLPRLWFSFFLDSGPSLSLALRAPCPRALRAGAGCGLAGALRLSELRRAACSGRRYDRHGAVSVVACPTIGDPARRFHSGVRRGAWRSLPKIDSSNAAGTEPGDRRGDRWSDRRRQRVFGQSAEMAGITCASCRYPRRGGLPVAPAVELSRSE